MLRKAYTIAYEPAAINGVHGYAYEIIHRGRHILGGWSSGKKHHAERQAIAEIDRFERRTAA